MKTIHDLGLHEIHEFSSNGSIEAMRVPGGWIYYTYLNGRRHTGVFVPYSEEFKTSTAYLPA